MEVNEVLVRVLRGHWRLLLVCLVLPAIVVAAAGFLAHPGYAATARFQASSSSPGSDTEADAVLNRVKGIATSPAVLGQALHEDNITTRGVEATAQEVDIARLGSSAVFDLTVTDADPALATTLAARLANDTVNFLNGVRGPSSKLVNDLTDSQNQLLAQRQQVAPRLALSTDPVLTANLSAQVAGIDQQLSQISSSLGQLQYSGASGASAVLISPAGPAVPPASKIVTDIGLAVVVGLVAGLMLAAILEVVRPRVADGRAFSREISAPLLGRLASSVGGARDVEVRTIGPELVVGLRVAAERAGVDSVVLVGPGQPHRLGSLARELDATATPQIEPTPPHGDQSTLGPDGGGRPSPHPRVLPPDGAGANGSGHLHGGAVTVLDRSWQVPGRPAQRLLVTAIHELAETTGGTTTPALVPVIPDLASYREVRRITDLAGATGWPVLGVIGGPPLGANRRGWKRPAWMAGAGRGLLRRHRS